MVGRYEGDRPGLPALLIGSHIDTVRNAGKYDGNFGVLAGVAAVAELNRRAERLPFAIEVVGFGDEEGVRFPVTLTGSRALAGTFDPAALAAVDADGIGYAEALRAFGGDPDAIAAAAKRPDEVLAYVEAHIEQGPVLEAENLGVGVVTGINGASRFIVRVGGTANHAGTVPMKLRRDALAGAAEMVLAVERRGLEGTDLVATVGKIEALPGAVNVIPGDAVFTIDLRSPDDAAPECRLGGDHWATWKPSPGGAGCRLPSSRPTMLPRPSARRGSSRNCPEPSAAAAWSLGSCRAVPGTTPWPWRRCAPSACCSPAAGTASATTRRSPSRWKTPIFRCACCWISSGHFDPAALTR